MNIFRTCALALLLSCTAEQAHAQQVVYMRSSSFLSVPKPITCLFLAVVGYYGKILLDHSNDYLKYENAAQDRKPAKTYPEKMQLVAKYIFNSFRATPANNTQLEHKASHEKAARANKVSLQDVVLNNLPEFAGKIFTPAKFGILFDKSIDPTEKIELGGQLLGNCLLPWGLQSWTTLFAGVSLSLLPAFKHAVRLYIKARDAAATGHQTPHARTYPDLDDVD